MEESSSDQIKVRIARCEDANTIARFTRQMALETENLVLTPETVLNGVQTALNDDRHGFYAVATSQIRVIGCLMVTYEWSDWRNCVQWWLQSVYVDKDFRRKGVFSALYRFTINLALQHEHVCGVRLYVDKSNRSAIETYKELGMKQTDYQIFEIDKNSF